MRHLVLALALAVSPINSVVCEIMCAFDDVATSDEGTLGPADHHCSHLVSLATAHEDDCPNHEITPALPSRLAGATLDLHGVIADLPTVPLFRSAATISFWSTSAVGWSPPPRPPSATSPLRI